MCKEKGLELVADGSALFMHLAAFVAFTTAAMYTGISESLYWIPFFDDPDNQTIAF